MSTPRDPDAREGRDRGASSVSEGSGTGRPSGAQGADDAYGAEQSAWQARWARLRDTRPVRAFFHFTDVGGAVLAAGMSYQAVFAVFAALWIGFSVFGIVLRGRPELLASLVDQINMFVPGLLGSGDDAAVDLRELLKGRGLNWSTGIAGAALLYVAVTWFTGTRRAMRIIFGLEVREYRNVLLLKLRDLLLGVGFMIAILTSAALTVLSSQLTETVVSWAGGDPDGWLVSGIGSVTRHAAMIVFDTVVLTAIFRFLAEVRVPHWTLLRGCLLGSLALFGIKVLGTAVLSGALSNPLLASFTVIIGLLIWFNLICRVLILTGCWIATGLDPAKGVVGAAQR